MLRRTLVMLLASAVIAAAVTLAPSRENAGPAPDYQLDPDWPRLPKDLKLGQVTGIATDAADRVYLFHRGKRPILILDAAGKVVNSWGDGLFKTAHGLRLDPAGNVWVTDLGLHQVMKFDPQGKLLLTLGKKNEPGVGQDQFNKPADIAFAADGSVYVADGYGNSRVVKFAADGKFLKEWGRKGKDEGEFNLPHAIRVDDRGLVYVGDRENNRVQVFDADGKFLRQWTMTGAPYGLFLTREGQMLLADGRANQTRILDLKGMVLRQWGDKGKMPGQFGMAHGICADSRGAIYVSEVDGMRVQKFVRKG